MTGFQVYLNAVWQLGISMTEEPKIVGIITARGGSKGIPRKNTVMFNNKPLIVHTIEASLRSKYVTETIVSSDDEEILMISKDNGAGIVKRPSELASDTASSESVIEDTIEQLKNRGQNFDVLVLLQPTSLLRDNIDIDSALAMFLESNATALISVYEPKHSPYKSFKLNKENFMEGLVDNKFPFARRQDLPRTFIHNGAIYAIYVSEFLERKSLLTDKTIPYIMSIEKSVDIDSLEDVKSGCLI